MARFWGGEGRARLGDRASIVARSHFDPPQGALAVRPHGIRLRADPHLSVTIAGDASARDGAAGAAGTSGYERARASKRRWSRADACNWNVGWSAGVLMGPDGADGADSVRRFVHNNASRPLLARSLASQWSEQRNT